MMMMKKKKKKKMMKKMKTKKKKKKWNSFPTNRRKLEDVNQCLLESSTM
jgi:hypothetical protein